MVYIYIYDSRLCCLHRYKQNDAYANENTSNQVFFFSLHFSRFFNHSCGNHRNQRLSVLQLRLPAEAATKVVEPRKESNSGHTASCGKPKTATIKRNIILTHTCTKNTHTKKYTRQDKAYDPLKGGGYR